MCCMSEDQINPTDTGPITGCVNSIITQFGLISGDPNRVKQDCKCLQTLMSGRFIPEIISFLKPLSPLLQKRSGPIAEYLFDFLEGIVRLSNDPQPLLIDLLQARDQKLVERSLDLVPELAQNNTLLSITSLLEYFGDQVRSDNQIIRNPEFYKKIEGTCGPGMVRLP